MIKRIRNRLITRLYIRYVFLPELFKMIEDEGCHPDVVFTPRALNPEWEDIEMAIREKDYYTLQ